MSTKTLRYLANIFLGKTREWNGAKRGRLGGHEEKKRQNDGQGHPSKYTLLWAGALAGFVNAATGGGGGLVLLLVLGKNPAIQKERAYAIAIAGALGFSLLSAGAYAALGRVQLRLALLVLPAMAAGGYVGARLVERLPARLLRAILGFCLLASGICMLFLR